jgi:dTMP kinase
VKKAAKEARGDLEPRLTFLLDLNVKEGLKRSGRKDRMEHKSVRFHERIRKGYLSLAKQNPKRFVVISSDAPKWEVQNKIKEKLDHVFN